MNVLGTRLRLAAPPERAVFGRLSRFGFALLLFAGFTTVGLLETLQLQVTGVLSDRPVGWTRSLTSTVPAWYTKLILLPAVLWLTHRFPFSRECWRRSLAVHVPASLAHSLVYLALASYLCDYLLGPADFPLPYLANLRRLILIYFVVELSYYWAVVGAYHAWDYHRKFREREREAAELALRTSRLEGSLARANLEALRMQLHPHFLFNTLNAISALMHRDAEAADRMIVPSLVLQPLVENAIKHGVARRRGRERVCIRAEIRKPEAMLELVVRDTGPGFGQGSEPGSGVGLANTRARLEQLYGAAAASETATLASGGAEVRVRLPFRPIALAPELEIPTYEAVGA